MLDIALTSYSILVFTAFTIQADTHLNNYFFLAVSDLSPVVSKYTHFII